MKNLLRAIAFAGVAASLLGAMCRKSHLPAALPEAPRTACFKSSPFDVMVRALRTPFAGEPLPLEITVRNGPVAGVYRWKVRGTQNSLDFGEILPEWIDRFEANETKVKFLEARVTTVYPFHVVATMESIGDRLRAPFPGHAWVKLFPFESTSGRISAHWDPVTQRPLLPEGMPDPHVLLPDGSSARIRRSGLAVTYLRAGEF